MRRLMAALRTLAAAAGALMLLATPAVPQAAETPVRVVSYFAASTLDPHPGGSGWFLQSHGVAETLFWVDDNLTIQPKLATSVEPEGDAWIVTLRPDVRFSDGSPMDAEAVAAALRSLNDNSPRATGSTGGMTVSVVDPLRVRIETARPVPVMAAVLAEFPIVMFREVDDGWVYTGPYVVSAFEPSSRLLLEPNPHYWGEVPAAPVELLRLQDPQSRVLAVESGEADLSFNLPASAMDRLAANGLVTRSVITTKTEMMFMNLDHPPLDDQRVRRAISLGIDRAMLVDAIGGGLPATSLFHPDFTFAPDDPLPYDPARAAALLDEAGWVPGDDGVRRRGGEALTLLLRHTTRQPDAVTVAPVLQAQLQALGILIDVRGYESTQPVLDAGEFDLIYFNSNTVPSGDGAFILDQWLRADGPRNHFGYASVRFEDLLATLGETREPAARDALLLDISALLAEEAPVAPLFAVEFHMAMTPRIADYNPHPSDYFIVRPDMGLVGR